MKLKFIFNEWCSRPLLSVLVLSGVGILLAIACRAQPMVGAEVVKRSIAMHQLQTAKTTALSDSAVPETTVLYSEEETEVQFMIDRLNAIHYYEAEVEDKSIHNSYAGAGLQLLITRDSEWLKKVYRMLNHDPVQMCKTLGRNQASVLGRYNPQDPKHDSGNPGTWLIHEFKHVNTKFVDGSGKKVSATSNAKAILSMANVYAYQNRLTSQTDFLGYLDQLWTNSHNYQIALGKIYYCNGCLGSNWHKAVPAETILAEESSETVEEDGEMLASASEAVYPLETSADPWNYSCPGHVDLNVTLHVYGLDEKNGLYSRDKIGANKSSFHEQWSGWNDEIRQYVKAIYDQNWETEYNFSVSSMILLGQPLSDSEMQEYLNMLPENLAQERLDVILFALQSVGKVPYYWGGKPSSEGYEANNFGTIIAADYKGRMIKGLDCSGWINWVYWSVFHEPYPYEGTDGFISSGIVIKKEELLPGDMAVVPGENSHVVMFLAWADPSRSQMYVIHETGGSINTVVVGVVSANWPYYRRMIQ